MRTLSRFFTRATALLLLLALTRPVAGQWTEITLTDNNSFKAQNMQFLAQHEGHLFVGTFNQGLYRSDDGGETWHLKIEGLTDRSVRDMAFGDDDLYVLVAGKGPFRSTDGGETWTPPGTGLPSFYPSFTSVGTFDGSVFAGTASNHQVFGVWRSDDDGATWRAVGDITVPHAVYTIFGWKGNLLVGTNRGAYQSSDKGETWTSLQNGLPGSSYVRKFVPVGDSLFALADDAVYLTADDGASWTRHTSGFAPFSSPSGLAVKNGSAFTVSSGNIHVASVSDLTWTAQTDSLSGDLNLLLGISRRHVYAAARNGFWRRPLADYGVSTVDRKIAAIPGVFGLEQNHPNPFSARTDIRFTLAEASQVTLKVYDLAGRELATLAGGLHPSGPHTVTLDAVHLPAGTYLYRLHAGARVETRLMTLIR